MATSREERSSLIEENFIRTWTMIGTAAGGKLISRDDYQLTLAAIDQIPYNHVQRCSPAGDTDAALGSILADLGDHDAILSVLSSSPDDLEERLVAHGCHPYLRLTGMALDLQAWSAERITPPAGVRIEEVRPDLLEVWAKLVLDQWHLSLEDHATLLAIHREFGFERVRRWLCFVDGAPSGRASVTLHDPSCAGIYGVGTRPEDRGRGLASILMTEILMTLKEAGVQTVVLQSTPAAVNIYRRFGFEEHGSIPVYALSDARLSSERLART